MKDDLEQLLTNLGLKRVKEILDSEIEKARKGQFTYEDFLARLLLSLIHI